ncbi:MAG: hypothetical protein ACTSXJ_07090 [Candidatus Baldrarchaeia archaeon]
MRNSVSILTLLMIGVSLIVLGIVLANLELLVKIIGKPAEVSMIGIP